MARILVMDDDDIFRPILREMLEFSGLDVEEAANGAIGLQKCKEKRIDLVISDVIMPEKEGLEVIRELKRDYPDIKIIAISGGGHIGPVDYLEMAQKLGAHATLMKPFSHQQLMDAVYELLGSSSEHSS